MSESQIIIGLTTIVVFGVGAQWIARRLEFPSILLLLPAGLLAGGVLDLVRPVQMFGDALFPTVSLLVALLLFQSGLKLRIADLPHEARTPVLRLVGIGGMVTFLGASLAVMAIFDVGVGLAFLVGAIIVVSGPTVVGPLLEVVRPRKAVASILNWEGTFLDPIGAILGVVVLNLILASGRGGIHPLFQMSARLALGVLVGVVAAALLVFVMSRFLVTENMEAAVALLFAVAAFGVAEVALSEAGLFATVVMGFVVANQRFVPTARIAGFGETLEVLIIGGLFIVLGALVEVDTLGKYALGTTVLVAVLVVLVRPASAGISLLGSAVGGRERALIGGLDPRGIVAAATAAQFSVSVTKDGFNGAFILPVVFGVILGTGVIYGVGTAPFARALGVARPRAKGVGIVGDSGWLVDLAGLLHDHGVSVLLIMSETARDDLPDDADLPTVALTDAQDRITAALEDADIAQVLIAGNPSPALEIVTAQLVERLGRRNVLRLPVPEPTEVASLIEARATARPFGAGITQTDIDRRIASGATVRVVDELDGRSMVPLAAVAADGRVNLRSPGATPPEGAPLIALVDAPVAIG